MTRDDHSPGSGEFEGDQTYVPPELGEVTNKGRYELLVFGSDTFVRHPLPDAGTLTIGRAEQADVRVDDASISRQHALLHVGEGDRGAVFLHIQDLGSSNGTKLRGQRLQPDAIVPLSPGEVVDLGMTMLIVQQGRTAGRPRRMWTHGYFEVRLEEECERAHRSGANFAVVRVRVPDDDLARRVEETLTAAIRPFDLLAMYAPGEYEALLVDTSGPQAEQMVRSVQARLGEREVKFGISVYPEDGRNPEALVSSAGARARGERRGERDAEQIVVVQDGAMQNLYRLIDRVAPSNISVLILGETGVGKEVVAEAVHQRSHRADKPFLRLNCAALSETLLESELFGHERGAFTGAVQTKPGLLETAQGGTVFLDEAGELPLSTQVKLLRVIEERQVLRVGSLQPRIIDVRFVSATNRDLEAEIKTGSFRKDLYYRLNGISVTIPPLRERRSEIGALCAAFGNAAKANLGYSGSVQIASDSMMLLENYYWPGNIRELRNVIERAVLLASGGLIGPEHLPVEKLCASMVEVPAPGAVYGGSTGSSGFLGAREAVSALRGLEEERTAPNVGGTDLKDEINELERRRIMEALESCGGNQTQAAKLLGMSRRTLVTRLDTYDIPRPRKSRD